MFVASTLLLAFAAHAHAHAPPGGYTKYWERYFDHVAKCGDETLHGVYQSISSDGHRTTLDPAVPEDGDPQPVARAFRDFADGMLYMCI
jgi:hypothetical protein